MMKITKFMIFSLVLAAPCLYFNSSLALAQSKDTVKLKLGHVLTTTHYYHKTALDLSSKASKYTNGKILIDVYPSSQLGAERDLIEGLRLGTVQLTIVNVAILNQFVPEFMVFQFPYLLKDYDHGVKVWNQVMRQRLSAKMEKAGLHVLGFVKASPRGVQTSKPIMKLADLKGLRIRTMETKIFVDTYKAFNAIPTPIPYSELVSALQSGVVDGADQGFSAFLSSKTFQVTPYFAHLEIVQTLSPLLISQNIWNKIPKESRDGIEKASEDSLKEQTRLYEEEIKKYEDMAKDSKFPFAYTFPDLTEFREAVKPIYAKYENEVGKDLIQKIAALK